MPKKSRHTKATKAKRQAREVQLIQERQPQQLKPKNAKLQSSGGAVSRSQYFAERYRYVNPELKRIGIIAGCIIVVIIIVSFVFG